MRQIYIYDRELLSILYPEYRVVYHPGEIKSKTIYAGSADVRYCSDLVSDCFMVEENASKEVDVSIPDRWSAIKVAYERKGKKKVPKALERYSQRIEDTDFMKEIRFFMARGKWVKTSRPFVKIYKLFDTLTENQNAFFKIYYDLRGVYSFYEVYASVLTFFKRVLESSGGEAETSDYYTKVIEKMRMRSDEICNVVKLVSSNHFDEAGFLSFLVGIRHGRAKR